MCLEWLRDSLEPPVVHQHTTEIGGEATFAGGRLRPAGVAGQKGAFLRQLSSCAQSGAVERSDGLIPYS